MDEIRDSDKFINDVHQVLLNMMRDIHELLMRHNIPYYINGGMLGMVRHGGFIPWDDDLDIVIERKYFNQLKKLFKSELPSYYKIDDVDSGIGIWGEIMKLEDSRTEIIEQGIVEPHGVFIDFFPLDSTPAKGLRDKICWMVVSLYAISFSDHSRLISKVVRIMGGFLGKNWLVHLLTHIVPRRGQYRTVYFGRQGRKETVAKEIYGIPQLHKFEGDYFYFPQNCDKLLTQFYGDYLKLPPVESRHTHIISFRRK